MQHTPLRNINVNKAPDRLQSENSSSCKQLNRRCKPNRRVHQTPERYDFSLPRNSGWVVGRPIEDSDCSILRRISGFWHFSYPVIAEDGTQAREFIYSMETSNYEEITPSQEKLVRQLSELLCCINNLKVGNPANKLLKTLGIAFYPEYFLMFMKVTKRHRRRQNAEHRRSKGTRSRRRKGMKSRRRKGAKYFYYRKGLTFLLSHCDVAFPVSLYRAISSGMVERKDLELSQKCFSRERGGSRYVLNINTVNDNRVEMRITESPKEVYLSEEDLNTTQSLNEALIPTAFDEKRIMNEIATVKDILAKVLAQPDLELYPEDKEFLHRLLQDDLWSENLTTIDPTTHIQE